MGNLALHSAEEPDDLRATTGTVEVPMKRDNDAALVLGARPIIQHQTAARHNGAQRGATANIDGAFVYALHMTESPVQQAESLPRYDDSPSLFVPETPEGATRVTRQLFGAVEESTGMTPSSPDSAYASRPMESDAAQLTTPAFSEYQTPSTGASASTLAPAVQRQSEQKSQSRHPNCRGKADKHHRLPDRLPKSVTVVRRDERPGMTTTVTARKSPLPEGRLSRRRRHERAEAVQGASSTSKRVSERLQWNDLDDSNTEESGSSAENDEQKVPLSRRSSRRSLSNKRPQLSLRADSSSSSSSESSIQEHPKQNHILKPPKYDGTGSFETFLAQFQNCALYNKWTKTEQLVHLRSCLEKDAGQVLWDYSAETTASLSRKIKVLKERFGEANQSDKYRFELKSRRRRPNETLRSLHSDIRRLTALALPDLQHRARETMACDYFIDALNDPNFALKVRERFPKDLDTALRVALQLEVCRCRLEHPERA